MRRVLSDFLNHYLPQTDDVAPQSSNAAFKFLRLMISVRHNFDVTIFHLQGMILG